MATRGIGDAFDEKNFVREYSTRYCSAAGATHSNISLLGQSTDSHFMV